MVFNPRSFGSRALRHSGLVQALREHELDFDIVEARSGEAARAAAEEAARDDVVVIAAGGDGTAHAVGNGVLRSGNPDAVMGVLPLGTGNDLPRALGRVGQGLEQALRALQNPRWSRIDVGRVTGGDYFLNGLGIGFDAEVVRRRSRQLISIPDYSPTAFTTILSYRSRTYRICWPGGEFEGRALMINFMNGISEGGGFRLAPNAQLQDGLLECSRIDPVNVLQFLRYFLAVRWGTHGRLPMLKRWQAARLTVESAEPIQYHLDGEYHQTSASDSLEIQILPQRLTILV